jgi:propanol-preferring alcohol dehydrogenase
LVKAALLRRLGAPLEMAKVPDPVPGPGEILLRVEASGVCHSDLHLAAGEWPDCAARMSLPGILGHEIVGRVAGIGAGVTGIGIGDRAGVGWLHSVCGRCEPCLEDAENVCLSRSVTSVDAPGGYAELACVRASQAVAVPGSLAPEQAAPFFCAGLTVFHACRIAGVAKGKRVAVFGVGGLGHLAVQAARIAGAEVVAVDVSPGKLELARSLGASEAWNAADPASIDRLKEGGGPHVAIVTAPSTAAYGLALKTLRRRGTLAVVGLPREDLTFFADDLAVGEYRIVGSAVGTRRETRDLLSLAASGAIRCRTETFPLEEVEDVFDRLRRGEILGRAVLSIAT